MTVRVGVVLSSTFVNPFTAKCGQGQISTKFPNFILSNFEKQMTPRESTGRDLSFEWSHHRMSSIDSKVRVTLQNPIQHSGSERVNGLIVERQRQRRRRLRKRHLKVTSRYFKLYCD